MRLPDHVLRRVFGGRESRRHARDTMRRLDRIVLITSFVTLAGQLPAIAAHGAFVAIPIVLALLCFIASLSVARRAAEPEIVSMCFWLAGVVCVASAPWVAGAPAAGLWILPSFSLPFVAIVWPRIVALPAALVAITLVAVSALVLEPQAVQQQPGALLAPVCTFIIVVALGGTLRRFDAQNRRAAVTDPLTGLGNRIAMEHDLEEHLALRRAGTPISMLVFDIDHFKSLNDRFGHAEGDAALRRTAIALVAAVGTHGRVYRYGGEEFIVLLVGRDRDDALATGEELRGAVAKIVVGGGPLVLSGGLATTRVGSRFDAADLFLRADQALYRAKEQGRDRICVAIPEVGGPTPRLTHESAGGSTPAVPAAMANGRRWTLVRTRLDRDQLRAVATLARDSQALAAGCLLALIGAVICVPSLGWWPVVVGVAAGSLLGPFSRGGLARIEAGGRGGTATLFWQALAGMAVVVAVVAAARGPALYLLPLVVLPAALPAAAYRPLGGALIAACGSVLIVACALLLAPQQVRADPVLVSAPVGLLWQVAIAGMVVMRSSVDHRARADVDPLTGALNRGALEARVAELAQEPGEHEPVALIVADLDRFKHINDTFGHNAGDEVLTGVAARLQSELRLADVIYRIGGEEFVILLTRTGAVEAGRIGERLRAVIAAGDIAGCAVTVSLGMAVSDAGGFEYAGAFDRADAALLDAKRAGRNRLVVAGESEAAVAAVVH